MSPVSQTGLWRDLQPTTTKTKTKDKWARAVFSGWGTGQKKPVSFSFHSQQVVRPPSLSRSPRPNPSPSWTQDPICWQQHKQGNFVSLWSLSSDIRTLKSNGFCPQYHHTHIHTEGNLVTPGDPGKCLSVCRCHQQGLSRDPTSTKKRKSILRGLSTKVSMQIKITKVGQNLHHKPNQGYSLLK